jgi:hypothetical protein
VGRGGVGGIVSCCGAWGSPGSDPAAELAVQAVRSAQAAPGRARRLPGPHSAPPRPASRPPHRRPVCRRGLHGAPGVLSGYSGGWGLTQPAAQWARSAVWSRAFTVKRLGSLVDQVCERGGRGEAGSGWQAPAAAAATAPLHTPCCPHTPARRGRADAGARGGLLLPAQTSCRRPPGGPGPCAGHAGPPAGAGGGVAHGRGGAGALPVRQPHAFRQGGRAGRPAGARRSGRRCRWLLPRRPGREGGGGLRLLPG